MLSSKDQQDLKEEQLEEQVPTMTTQNEPIVGEKRPREDDDLQPQEPQQRRTPPQDDKAALDHTPPSQSGAKDSNSHVHGNMNVNQYSVPMNGMGSTGNNGGYDALYIGDLQWVRWSRRLVFYSCLSKEGLYSRLILTVDHR